MPGTLDYEADRPQDLTLGVGMGPQGPLPSRGIHRRPQLQCPSRGDPWVLAAQLTREPALPQGPQRAGASPGSQFAWQEGAWWGRGGEEADCSPGSYTFSPRSLRCHGLGAGDRVSMAGPALIPGLNKWLVLGLLLLSGTARGARRPPGFALSTGLSPALASSAFRLSLLVPPVSL